jgi:hypothetical protein
VSLHDAYGAVQHHRSWRPQLLCLIQSPSTLGAAEPAPGQLAFSRQRTLSSLSDRAADGPSVEPSAEELVAGVGAGDPTVGAEEARLDAEAGAVFALAHHLKEGRGLTVAATVVTRGAPDVCEHDLFVLAKERIMRLAHRARLACFADATVSPFFGLAVGVVINCVGVGALRPNTLLVGWRFYPDDKPAKPQPRHSADEAAAAAARARGEGELASELLQGLERAIGFGKAVLLLCTHAGDAPWDRGYRREHPLSKKSTIDIWWLDQRGALPLIIAHLLQRHEALSCCKLRVFMPTQVRGSAAPLARGPPPRTCGTLPLLPTPSSTPPLPRRRATAGWALTLPPRMCHPLPPSPRSQETRDGVVGAEPESPTAPDARFPDASLAELHLRSFMALLRIKAAHVEVVRELVNVQPEYLQGCHDGPSNGAARAVSPNEDRKSSVRRAGVPPSV